MFNTLSAVQSTVDTFVSCRIVPWRKPPNASMVCILAMGGGGGGGGAGRSTTTTASGGGSGASAEWSLVLVPAAILPESLYVTAGLGGVGGTGSAVDNGGPVAASDGGLSCVSTYPSTSLTEDQNLFALSRAGGGSFGSSGGSLGGPSSDDGPRSLVIRGRASGVNGYAGTADGTDVTAQTVFGAGRPWTSGQGGGGINMVGATDGTGGGWSAVANTLNLAVSTPAASGSSGSSGFNHIMSGAGYAGTGGTGNAAGTGGNGGNGFGYGCGGSGGGAGRDAGGNGGMGGPGVVYIISW